MKPLPANIPRHKTPQAWPIFFARFLRVCAAILFLMPAIGSSRKLPAQQQPLATEEPANAPVVGRPDPLRESALSGEFKQLAKQPLAASDGPLDSPWRKDLASVFSFIERIPVDLVEQGAFKYRRARIRLTAKAREESKKPFRLLEDFKTSPELYWGQAVAICGEVTELRQIPAAEKGEAKSVWHTGLLKVWNDDKTVKFITHLLPEDFPHGDDLHVPAEVIGYVFSATVEMGKPPAPLLVARGVHPLKPQLDSQTLADVKDRTIGISDREWEAYYRTLLHAKLVDQTALKKQAAEFWSKRKKQVKPPRPLFVDLFKTFEKEPDIYRGQAVTLDGTLMELKKWDETAADRANDFGLETLYEAWIYNEDAQTNPTVVVFSENPDKLPLGTNLILPVKVTGYVFKMYGYKSHDTKNPLHVAPMLLAKTLTKLPATEPEPFPIAWVAGGFAVLAVGLVWFVWSSSRKDKQFRQRKITQEEEEPPPQFDNLTGE